MSKTGSINYRTKFLSIAVLLTLVAGALVILPSEVNAESRPGGTLLNDRPAYTYNTGWWWTEQPDDLQFKVPTKTNYYTAIAIQNRNTGEDFDLFAYNDYSMTQLIGSSTKGSNVIDFVVIDGHTYTGNFKYAQVYKFTGSNWNSGIRIESDYHSVAADLYGSDPDANGPLVIGTTKNSLFEYHGTGTYSGTLRGEQPLVNMYDVYLDADGQYDFDITSVYGNQLLAMYLFKGSGNSDDALANDLATSNGQSLSFSYDPEVSGWYGLCVIDQNHAYDPTSPYDSYQILISSDFEMSSEPTSNLIAPGMNATYMIDVDSLGITKDIDLHYRWQNAAGTNVSTPSGAVATLSADDVNAGGVGTESVSLNVTTTSSLAAGSYYLKVFGNDTGVGGKERFVGVTLVVSTNPDFFLTSSPEIRVISPGTTTTYTLEMDTINSFSSNVTLSAVSVPATSTLNFTFDPVHINVTNPTVNMTVTTTSSTPVQFYDITLSGTGASLTRYANTTLRIKEPISIDMITPTLSELVSGVYMFKASAGDPTGTESVKLTFGGKMANAGELNMYYNSASGFWERSVNTFSYLDGPSSLNITAEDYSGGITTLGPMNFTLSNSAPNPIISTPLDRSYVTGTSMPISVNTTSHVISVRFRVDQNAWTPMTRSGNTWTGSWDTTLITDGDHTLSIDAKDTAGLTGENSVTIFVDNTNPTANINSPIDGQYVEGSYTFRIVATDTVGVNHVDINIFGSNITLPYNPITSSYEYTVTTSTKPDGEYTTYAKAYDNVNQSIQSELITFYIDNNDPSLGIVTPIDNEIIGGNFTIQATSSDTFLNSIVYRIDSTGWQNFSGSEPDWSVVYDTSALTDGEHTLTVKSVDNMSHVTDQAITFIVDNTNPTCSLVSPFTDQFLGGVETFKVSSTDSVGIDRVTLDVFSDTVQTTFNQQNGYFEYAINTLTVADGTFTVTAHAYDLSGKQTDSFTVSFRVDNNAPEMSINGLQTGDYVEGMIDFNLSVTDAFLNDVSYSVDGGGWIAINMTWNTSNLLDGDHSITFRSRDLAGHSTTQSIDLIVDNNVPVCAINGPVPLEYIEGAYRFRLSASDAVGIERVEINVFDNNFTAIFSVSSGYYEFNSDTSIQSDGTYTTYAITYDKSGKMSTSPPVMFHVDNNAPVLRINHPLEGDYLEGYVNMMINATDVFLNRVEYDVDGSGWVPINTTMNTTMFGDGEHTINFRAIDKAGHVTISSSHVIIDNTDPYGAISDPVTDQFIDGTALFRAVASDIVGIDEVKIEVFGDILDMNYNAATGFYEYRTDTRLIPDGTYEMNLSVTDRSGKMIQLGPLQFNIDNQFPELVVNELVDGNILEGLFEFNTTAHDVFLSRVEYEVDSTGWVLINNTLNTTRYGDGSHIINVRAVDRSGKTKTFEFDILIDNMAPTCTINSPVEDEFVEGTITIRVTAFDQVQIDYVKIHVYNIEARVPFNANTGYYEYTSNTITWGSGEDGVRNVTATVYDLTGKSYTYGPVNFKIDNRPPTININSPQEGEVLSGLFFFDVENGDVFKKGTEYNIDGASWQPVSIGWNTNLVPDGLHEVTIRATDLAGHTTTEVIFVYVDNHAPEVSIAGPTENEFVEGTYIFRVAATDEVGITKVIMKVGTEKKTLSFNTQSGYYEYMLDTRTLLDGTYTINATATDVANRAVTTGNLQFRVDNNAPELTVESPVKDQLISGVFVVRARTTDEFPGMVRYAIDGTTWFDVTTPWNSTMVNDGPHSISVKTEDQAGHSTQFNVNVNVDNTAPVISQATITPGQILAGIQTMRFYAYDSIGIRQVMLSIDEGAPFEIYRGEGGLYYEYLLDTRILSDGDHSITITAIDRAGNSDGSTYGIKIDNSGPEIGLDYYWLEGEEEVRIGDVKEGNSVVFKATVIDPSGVEVVMINIDSSGWREMTPDSNDSNPDTYVLFWPTSGSIGGAHVFQIRTADKLGNEAHRSGLISVKQHEEQTTFIESFTDALPVIWLILFIILIIVIGVLAYLGILTSWARGEGRSKKPPAEGGEQAPPADNKPAKKKGGFKFGKKKDDNVEEWESEDA